MDALIEYLHHENIEYEVNADIKTLVSFKIGGIARIVIYPYKISQIRGVINALINLNVRYYILGCGTNCYFSDKGFNGAIVSTIKLNDISYV